MAPRALCSSLRGSRVAGGHSAHTTLFSLWIRLKFEQVVDRSVFCSLPYGVGSQCEYSYNHDIFQDYSRMLVVSCLHYLMAVSYTIRLHPPFDGSLMGLQLAPLHTSSSLHECDRLELQTPLSTVVN